MVTHPAGIPTRPVSCSSYQLLVSWTPGCMWTKLDTLPSKRQNNPSRGFTSGGKLDTTFFHALILIVSAQYVIYYFYGLGHKNDSVLLVSGYSRSAGGDMVQIKHWVCHISSTVMVVQQAHVLFEWLSRRLSPWLGAFHLVLWSESPSDKCTKLRTVTTSNNRAHGLQSLHYSLFVQHLHRCCSSSTTHLWWITHQMQRQWRGCNSSGTCTFHGTGFCLLFFKSFHTFVFRFVV